MTGLAVLVVERLGRRPLLLGGVSGIVSTLFSSMSICVCPISRAEANIRLP